MMMKRLVPLAAPLVPTLVPAQSLTLTNLKGPITRICGTGQATSIAALWAQLAACQPVAPVPSPAPGFVISPTLDGAAPFHVAFDVKQGLEATVGTPAPYDADRGAFRFVCGGDGPLKTDDPVLYPGQPGKSHLHQVWGNTEFSAFTTPASLHASAATNCNATPFALNRSSYWMPALVNDHGEAIRPDLVVVYYKQPALTSQQCIAGSATFIGTCVSIPNQIRFIFGWNPVKPDAKVEGASWYCTGGDGKHYADLDAVFASGCKAGDTLVANTLAPDCWDGTYLDTPDHRAHVAYGQWLPSGRYACPATHPYVIPQEENKAMWTVTADMIAADGRARIGLSSDHMKPDAKPGETLHADYMEGWDAAAKAMWWNGCIQKRLSCNAGDLGNGFKLIGAAQPSYGWINRTPRSRTF